ncbi:MAG: hypothetical protein AAF763_05345 [Pseudomonadota bacterium]
MDRARANLRGRVVAAFCALALMLTGFAHRPLAADPNPPGPELAAYLAMGGSLADLCLWAPDADPETVHADCPACTLAKGMAVGPPCMSASRIAAWPYEVVPAATSVLPAGLGARAPPARGPPPSRMS